MSLVMLSAALVMLSAALVMLSAALVMLSESLVILSVAKDLSRWAARCFAEFTLSVANGLSMTGLDLALTKYSSHP